MAASSSAGRRALCAAAAAAALVVAACRDSRGGAAPIGREPAGEVVPPAAADAGEPSRADASRAAGPAADLGPSDSPPGAGAAPPDAVPAVALIASDDPAVTAALRAGIELAFEESRAAGGPALTLRVTEATAKWSSATDGAVREAVEKGAVALVTPPERRHAHLLSQLGTRLRIPVLSTSPAYGVVAAGSTYVAAVVPAAEGVRDEAPVPPAFDAAAPAAAPFVAAFRARHGRAPGAWDAVGYDAGRCAVEAVRAHGLRREGLIDALETAPPVRGAAWTLTFARNGSSRRTAAER